MVAALPPLAKRAVLLVAAALFGGALGGAAAQPGLADQDVVLAPTVLLTSEQAEELTALVAADSSARVRFEGVRRQADAALDRPPRPVGEVVYEGRLESDPKRVATKRALLDMEALRALSYAYAVTGEAAYAEGARAYALAWARTTRPTGNPIDMNKLDDLALAYAVAGPAMPPEERETLEAWLREVAERLISEGPPEERGNWASKRLKMVGLVGSALGERRFADYARDRFRRYVDANLYADGTSHDLLRRDALHYHLSGLVPLLELAFAAPAHLGDDLYRYVGAGGGSVEKAVRYVAPYALGERVHHEWAESEVGFDRERFEAGDAFYRPGRPWNPEEPEARFALALAAGFDADVLPILRHVTGSDATYSTWTSVVASVHREAR